MINQAKNSPVLKRQLANHIRRNSKSSNDFNETLAIQSVYKTTEFSERQVEVLTDVFDKSKTDDGFDSGAVFLRVLKEPNIGENQAKLIGTLAEKSRLKNEIDETQVAYRVLNNEPTDVQTELLQRIVDTRGPSNGVQEEAAVYRVLGNDQLDMNAAQLLGDLVEHGNNKNGFHENLAFLKLVDVKAGAVTDEKLEDLSSIFKGANPDNGLNDTQVFFAALDS